MQTINLKQYYPFCTEDTFVEVSDEIVEAFLLDKRAEAARERKMYRYKAFYSLDCDDGIENAAVDKEHLSVPLRLEKCGNGDRGPDGFVQTSRIVHDFAVVGQVCRHRTEWNGKRFDGNIRHDFP